jgi:hypothetical protein
MGEMKAADIHAIAAFALEAINVAVVGDRGVREE